MKNKQTEESPLQAAFRVLLPKLRWNPVDTDVVPSAMRARYRGFGACVYENLFLEHGQYRRTNDLAANLALYDKFECIAAPWDPKELGEHTVIMSARRHGKSESVKRAINAAYGRAATQEGTMTMSPVHKVITHTVETVKTTTINGIIPFESIIAALGLDPSTRLWVTVPGGGDWSHEQLSLKEFPIEFRFEHEEREVESKPS